MPKTNKPKRTRLNMRIPEVLLEWAKKHAREKHTSVTQLVVDYFAKMKETADGSR